MTSGFQSPNHTQVPNDLFEIYLAEMEKSELKVVLAVIRHTLGFHRRKTRISIRDLKEMTGLSNDGIYAGAWAAQKRGLLKKHQDGGVTEWEIIWNDPPDVGVDGVPVTGTVFRPSEQGDPAIGTEAIQPSEQGDPAIGTPSIKESSKETPKETSKEKDTAVSVEELSHEAADQIAGWGAMMAGKRDYWPMAPAHVKPILEAFTEVWEDVFDRKLLKGDRGIFLKQAETLRDNWGEGVEEFIVDAGRKHKGRIDQGAKLPLNGPLSIEWAIREVIHESLGAEKAAEKFKDFWDPPTAEEVEA